MLAIIVASPKFFTLVSNHTLTRIYNYWLRIFRSKTSNELNEVYTKVFKTSKARYTLQAASFRSFLEINRKFHKVERYIHLSIKNMHIPMIFAFQEFTKYK